MAITIRSSFKIDATPAETWATMVDIERSAPCFPGAELKELQPDGSYKGAFTVKLGPLTLKFAGKFKIAEQNDVDRQVVVSASGTDTKGRGGADANIRANVSDEGGKTKVDVVSEVNLSGTVAQYGRGAGMIEALSQQLLNQFAKNLTALIESESSASASMSASVPVSALGDSGVAAESSGSASADDAFATGAMRIGAASGNTTSAATPGTTPPPPVRRPLPPPAAPLDAGALMRGALWQSIRNFFARLFGAKQQN
jgi:uncharacterized protein